jgi:hypothetical protein
VFPTKRTATALIDDLRLGTCLLHAVPGAVGIIRTGVDGCHVVAQHRSDAALTPCQLRSALLEPMVSGVPHLADVITAIDVVGGVVDLGGGLYECGHPTEPDQRWFVSTLSADTIRSIAQHCPPDIDHADVSVRVAADLELGVCAVCLSSGSAGLRLDVAACWFHSQCLVEELLLGVA